MAPLDKIHNITLILLFGKITYPIQTIFPRCIHTNITRVGNETIHNGVVSIVLIGQEVYYKFGYIKLMNTKNFQGTVKLGAHSCANRD
jgi:hypothetical protein